MRRILILASALGLALVAPASGAPVDGFASQLAAERSALAAARAQAAEAEARATQLDREAQGLRDAAARDRAARTLVAARIQASAPVLRRNSARWRNSWLRCNCSPAVRR